MLSLGRTYESSCVYTYRLLYIHSSVNIHVYCVYLYIVETYTSVTCVFTVEHNKQKLLLSKVDFQPHMNLVKSWHLQIACATSPGKSCFQKNICVHLRLKMTRPEWTRGGPDNALLFLLTKIGRFGNLLASSRAFRLISWFQLEPTQLTLLLWSYLTPQCFRRSIEYWKTIDTHIDMTSRSSCSTSDSSFAYSHTTRSRQALVISS